MELLLLVCTITVMWITTIFLVKNVGNSPTEEEGEETQEEKKQ